MRVEGNAPQGAQCALHVDRPGLQVCARCGSFMCLECSQAGQQALCPTCRALAGPEAFPFSRDDFDFSRLWDHAFNAFKREWLMLCVAVVIFGGVAMAGGLAINVINTVLIRLMGVSADPSEPMSVVREAVISVLLSQTIGMVVNLLIQGVAVMGLYRVLMDALLGRKADVGRMFSQLPKLGRYVLANLLVFVVVTIPVLILFGLFGAAAVASIGLETLRNLSVDSLDRLVTPTVVLGFVVIFPLMLAYGLAMLPLSLFVPAELVVSEATPLEAIRRVWAMASGHRLEVIGYSFVAGVVSLLGMVLCCVGLIPSLALGYLVTLSLFLALRSSSQFPAAQHD